MNTHLGRPLIELRKYGVHARNKSGFSSILHTFLAMAATRSLESPRLLSGMGSFQNRDLRRGYLLCGETVLFTWREAIEKYCASLTTLLVKYQKLGLT